MNRPSRAHIERARRLLVHEGAAVSADTCAAAAWRVFDKLTSNLAPLVGAAGVQALFVRSAKLAKGEVACLAEASTLNSTKLRECLQAQDPAADRTRRHRDGDGRAGGFLHRSSIQSPRHRLSHRRHHHHPALGRDRRAAQACVGSGQGARQPAQQRLREYEITSDGGIVVGHALKGYDGLFTGAPVKGEEQRK
jgi:hypothetical protein